MKDSDNAFAGMAKMVYYELPHHHSVTNPVCFLFKKLELKNRIPNHVFALYYQNNIFQFPIPFCKADIDNNLYDGKSNSVPLCPPILFSKPNEETKYYRGIKDLSSDKKIREEEVITFSFEPNIMSTLKAYDGKTGEETDTAFNPDDIAEIYIAPYDSKTTLFNIGAKLHFNPE